jgi:hypothetical protein
MAARPRKRRRRRVDDALMEDDIETADAIIQHSVMHEADDGPLEEIIETPVWINRPQGNPKTENGQPKARSAKTMPQDAAQAQEGNTPPEMPEWEEDTGGHEKPGGKKKRTQQDYLQQFVDRVHPMLEAFLSREALPNAASCVRCAGGSAAIWRCKDCTSPSLMCRCCMRETHRTNPLHHVERWTGRYFRAAQLWEVGVYILIPHHSGEGICPTLQWNEKNLERFQAQKDRQEQLQCDPDTVFMDHEVGEDEKRPQDDISYEADLSADADMGRRLDDMFNNAAGDISSEDGDDDNGDKDVMHPPNYMPVIDRTDAAGQNTTAWQSDAAGHNNTASQSWQNDAAGQDNAARQSSTAWQSDAAGQDNTASESNPWQNNAAGQDNAARQNGAAGQSDAGAPPRADGLSNPFVRVVHSNGVHHIALVYCSCHGHEHVHSDLMAQRLIPTSFTRYRTLFTHAVLDDFRITNLECKASAYQYFQKLRRQTSPMAPETVPNLYQELRRMSRIWRWMKKLKWAGFAHSDEQTTVAAGGVLANFCPACPQVGVNIPKDWALDPQRWVYQRSFVADGNFKADHVRQKKNDDVWLSEGGGMMSVRSEYDEFLLKAKERSTVSCARVRRHLV